MGSFVNESLARGEAVRYTALVSLWRYAFNFVLGGVVALVSVSALLGSLLGSRASGSFGIGGSILLLGAACLLTWPFIARRSTELVITDKRLIAKYGVLSTQSIEIRFDKIETVRVTQGLLGRLLNYGDIVVTGTGSTFDPIRNIASAMKFRTALNEAMDPAINTGNAHAAA